MHSSCKSTRKNTRENEKKKISESDYVYLLKLYVKTSKTAS